MFQSYSYHTVNPNPILAIYTLILNTPTFFQIFGEEWLFGYRKMEDEVIDRFFYYVDDILSSLVSYYHEFNQERYEDLLEQCQYILS